MAEWTLQLSLERGVVPPAANEATASTLKVVPWSVRSSLPLASDHNLGSLAEAIQRELVWDLFMFDGHTTAEGSALDTAKLRFLDPSLSPIELLLRDGAPVLASASPSQHVANPRILVPLRAATMRFANCGSSVHMATTRRVVRVNRDGWGGGVVICNFPLSNESVNAVTFRISKTTLGHESPSPQRGAADDDALRDLPVVGDEVPIVAIGLCDGSVETDGDDATIFGVHQRSWLVEPVSGAIHNGGTTSKQTFLDAQQLRVSSCMTITLLLDTTKGTVFLVQNGRPIGGFNVTKVLADTMYPVVELYSRGASVELV